jgi:hypothetical protein
VTSACQVQDAHSKSPKTWVARSGTCPVMNARKGDERQKSYNETSLAMSAKREVHQLLVKAVLLILE